MSIKVYKNDDGSYEWVEGTFTREDFLASKEAEDGAKWLDENTEVVSRPKR